MSAYQPWTSMNIDFWQGFCRSDFLSFAQKNRWFAGKTRCPHGASLGHIVQCSIRSFFLLIIHVDYDDGQESYFLPAGFSHLSTENLPAAVIVKKDRSDDPGTALIDATYDESLRQMLFEQFTLTLDQSHFSKVVLRSIDEPYRSSEILNVDSTNTLMVFNDRYLFKLYRKSTSKMDAEMEMLGCLERSATFAKHVPTCYGAIVYLDTHQTPIASIMVESFVRDAFDCWTIVTRLVDHPLPVRSLTETVTVLGQRTAEMHLRLHQLDAANKEFALEGFTEEYRRDVTRSLIERLERCLCQSMNDSKLLLLKFIRNFANRSFQSKRIRIHGDFHLGQVLFQPANGDYIIIDFEGEPSQNHLRQRTLKHSPMKDVAAMVRSFHYAAVLTSNCWFEHVRDAFLQAYLVHSSSLWNDRDECTDLFLFHSLDRTVHELDYEMNYRPKWIEIPLRGLVDLISRIGTNNVSQ